MASVDLKSRIKSPASFWIFISFLVHRLLIVLQCLNDWKQEWRRVCTDDQREWIDSISENAESIPGFEPGSLWPLRHHHCLKLKATWQFCCRVFDAGVGHRGAQVHADPVPADRPEELHQVLEEGDPAVENQFAQRHPRQRIWRQNGESVEKLFNFKPLVFKGLPPPWWIYSSCAIS